MVSPQADFLKAGHEFAQAVGAHDERGHGAADIETGEAGEGLRVQAESGGGGLVCGVPAGQGGCQGRLSLTGHGCGREHRAYVLCGGR